MTEFTGGRKGVWGACGSVFSLQGSRRRLESSGVSGLSGKYYNLALMVYKNPAYPQSTAVCLFD